MSTVDQTRPADLARAMSGDVRLADDLERLIARIPARKSVHMSAREYRYVAAVIARRSPCNLLVFGVGLDSALWERANRDGRTVFLEHSPKWARFTRRQGDFDVRVVKYGTHRYQWRRLLREADGALTMELPADIRSESWDVVFVDAPTGNWPTSIGRMKSIHEAHRIAREGAGGDSGGSGVDVFVHDCGRRVERAYCDHFLNEHEMISAFDRLRHYRS